MAWIGNMLEPMAVNMTIDLNNATFADLVALVDAARVAGVDGTPTLFVNGKRVTDHSLAALSAAVEPLLTR